jgi:hypothetical protein
MTVSKEKYNYFLKHNTLFVLLLYFLSFNFIYFFALTEKYAWSDDYPSITETNGHISHTLGDLRPGYALLLKITFGNVGKIEDLALIRFFTISFIAILAWKAWQVLTGTINGVLLWVIIAVGLSTYSFSSVVFFATAVGVPLAALFSLIGNDFLLNGSKTRKSLGITLISIAFLIYPLGALFPLSVYGIKFLFDDSSLKKSITNLYKILVWNLGIAFISLAFTRFYLQSFLGVQPNLRTSPVSYSQLSDSLVFQIPRYLTQSLRPFFFSSPSNLVAVMQAIAVLAPLVIFFYKGKPKRVKFLCISIFVFFSSLLPLIFTGYKQIELRFLISTNFYFTCSALVAAINLMPSLVSFVRKANIYSLTLLTVAGILSCVVSNTLFFIRGVQPIVNETKNFLSDELTKCIASGQRKISIIPQERISLQRSRIGMLSQNSDLESPWVPFSAALLISQEISKQSVLTIKFGEEKEMQIETCRIELNQIPIESKR